MSRADGRAVPDAKVEIWTADDDGNYDVQYAGGTTRGPRPMFAAADGGYRFWSVRRRPIRSRTTARWATAQGAGRTRGGPRTSTS